MACPTTKEAVIIDPAPGSAAPIGQYLEKNHLIPIKILLTHSHWDHIADASALKEKYGIGVFVHREDSPNLESPGADLLPLRMNCPPVKPEGFLNEGDLIPVGKLQLEVIHTPGHTPGGVCFYEKSQGILISGDTLFKGTIGNLSFPTGRPKLMWKSLEKLSKLPPETRVFPGHGEITTIKAESWLSKAETIFG